MRISTSYSRRFGAADLFLARFFRSFLALADAVTIVNRLKFFVNHVTLSYDILSARWHSTIVLVTGECEGVADAHQLDAEMDDFRGYDIPPSSQSQTVLPHIFT